MPRSGRAGEHQPRHLPSPYPAPVRRGLRHRRARAGGDPHKVEKGTLAIVGVVLDRSTPESFGAVRGGGETAPRRARLPYLVAGDFDYFLKIRVRDLADFNKLHARTLLALPGVRQTRTFFVMKEVIDNAPLEF
jgi:Lrp/AsnC family leucine-responsive transcriptional regulator